MRKFVCGAVVVTMLAAPAVASAFHVPGATYTGTISTSVSQPATFSLTVSNDGSTLDFTASNFGNMTCNGVTLGPITGIPISNHSFSYLSGDGQNSASGTFDSPGGVGGGVQVLITPCTTGSHAWTAETPVAGPDAKIARGSDASLTGGGIYNTTAQGQTRKWSAKRGQRRHFDVVIENEGTIPGSFTVKGCGSSKGLKVTYDDNGDNVTADIVAGDYETSEVADGADTGFGLDIKVKKKAKVGKTKSCKITTEGDGGTDAVKAQLKVKRG